MKRSCGSCLVLCILKHAHDVLGLQLHFNSRSLNSGFQSVKLFSKYDGGDDGELIMTPSIEGIPVKNNSASGRRRFFVEGLNLLSATFISSSLVANPAYAATAAPENAQGLVKPKGISGGLPKKILAVGRVMVRMNE